MKNCFMILLSVLFLSSVVLADETGGKLAIGIRGGASTYAGDISDLTFWPFYDLNATFWFTDHIGLGFNYGNGFLAAAEDVKGTEQYFKTHMWEYNFLLKYKLLPQSSLNPYLTAGYTMMTIDPKSRDGYRLLNNALEKYDRSNWAIPVGFGLAYFLTDYIALEGEVRYHHSGTDYLDDRDEGSRKDGWTTAALGLGLYIGKPKDTDKDGIIDKLDKDPLHAEDFDKFQDEDGAPDPDNDMDGIADMDDKAPLDPEDQDGYQDKDGLPDPDNDGDGIPDANDKCAGTDTNLDTKEDMDSFEDSDGCPDLDNDGDGIADVDDACDDKPETVNGYEDADGCPDKKPEIAVEKGKAIVLEGITFATGSNNISNESYEILDKVMRTMQENPELEVEIRGYTDNVGNYEKNVKLSQKTCKEQKN